MPDVTTPLEEAWQLGQRALAYVERCGFDVNQYAENREGDWELGRTAPQEADFGQACYIGAYRIAAGINPEPGRVAADHGDGPELTLALEAADDVAREIVGSSSDRFKADVNGILRRHFVEYRDEQGFGLDYSYGGAWTWESKDIAPGRLVEAVGLVDYRTSIKSLAEQKDAALHLLRGALAKLSARMDAAA